MLYVFAAQPFRQAPCMAAADGTVLTMTSRGAGCLIRNASSASKSAVRFER